MGQKETNLKNKHDRTLTRWQRLWRVNNGVGWAGEIVEKTVHVLTMLNPRPFRAVEKGLHVDQVGFDSVVITDEMVGKRVAVFVGCELKATRGDKLSPDQVKTRNIIVKMGGIHREVRECGRVIESSELFLQTRKDEHHNASQQQTSKQ